MEKWPVRESVQLIIIKSWVTWRGWIEVTVPCSFHGNILRKLIILNLGPDIFFLKKKVELEGQKNFSSMDAVEVEWIQGETGKQVENSYCFLPRESHLRTGCVCRAGGHIERTVATLMPPLNAYRKDVCGAINFSTHWQTELANLALAAGCQHKIPCRLTPLLSQQPG